MALKLDLSASLSLGSLEEDEIQENLLDDADESLEFITQGFDNENDQHEQKNKALHSIGFANKFKSIKKFERPTSVQIEKAKELCATSALQTKDFNQNNN